MRAPILPLLLAVSPTGIAAQWMTSASPHFGAMTIPDRGAAAYVGVTLDRFTPNGKPTDPGIYNGIDRTIAFNFLNYSLASRSKRWPDLIYRATFQLGWGHDQPTEWIQNKLHQLADKLPIESVDPRNDVLDGAFNLELVQWGPLGGNAERFLGGGLTVGTPYSEAWLQIGTSSRWGSAWPQISGMVRVGAPLLGGAFPRAEIADRYGVAEALFELPLDAWLGIAWLPDAFISVRQDSGFFVDGSGRAIAERHGSFGLMGPNDSWRFEAWNEYFGGRIIDKGPTGGGRLYFKVRGSGLLDWLP